MKREKKSLLPGAAFAALVAAVIVFCVLLNVEKNMMEEFEKGKILVTVKEIAMGTILTEYNMDEYVEEKELDIQLIPSAAVTQKEVLYQQIATNNLDQGTMITNAMFTKIDRQIGGLREAVVAGFKAEDLYQVVSGILRSGDHIHIYTVDPETGNTFLVWENILVREVFDAAGVSIPAQDRTTAAQRVNILMDKVNVEQFYSELAKGSLRVVKVIE